MDDSTHSAAVAGCTASAAHRRDHHHVDDADVCHPHVVEVIRLGERGLVVCHDCESDSGFVPHRDAERLAAHHRHATEAAHARIAAPAAAA